MLKRIKIFKQIIFTVAIAAFSGQAVAELKYVGHHNVKRYYPVGGTTTYLTLEAPHENPAGCPQNFYYAMNKDHPEFEEYRKLILTAKASGQKLGVYVWADPGKCIGAYPSIYSIFIQ